MNETRFDPYAPRFADPNQYAALTEFETIALEKIKLHCSRFFSGAMLQEIRFNRRAAEMMGEQIAYQIEAMVYGREAWEQTIEKRTETGKMQETTAESVSETGFKRIPKTWLDHSKHTFLEWMRHSRINEWVEAQGWPDEGRPSLKEWAARRVRIWWGKRRARLQWEEIVTEIHHSHFYKVTPITKHIEVKKHFHICPHLDIKTNGPHFQFLANASEVR